MAVERTLLRVLPFAPGSWVVLEAVWSGIGRTAETLAVIIVGS